jgi:hypothetical protein
MRRFPVCHSERSEESGRVGGTVSVVDTLSHDSSHRPPSQNWQQILARLRRARIESRGYGGGKYRLHSASYNLSAAAPFASAVHPPMCGVRMRRGSSGQVRCGGSTSNTSTARPPR